MGKVAGIDSSTTGTSIVVCDSDSGAVLKQGHAPHPLAEGEQPTELDPQAWLLSLGEAAKGEYRTDLAERALGHPVQLPDVLAPAEPAGQTPEGLLISAGTGDTMAAALGLGLAPGDAVVSLGAGGTVFAVHHEAVKDAT